MRSLTESVHVVTGAASGIGRGIALQMAQHSGTIVCADLNKNAAEEAVKEIRGLGGSAMAHEVDVSNYDDITSLFESVSQEFGRLDGVVSNAGVHGTGSVTEVSLFNWDKTLDVNLTGAMLVARAAVPYLQVRGKGSILFTASVSATKAFVNQAAYAATKGAIVALTRQMALDFAKHQIRVNCLSPGLIKTPLVEEMYKQRAIAQGTSPEDDFAQTAMRYPLGRLGTPAEVGDLASFLQSDSASWITGQNFIIDGGLSII